MSPQLRHRWGLWIDRFGWSLIPLSLGIVVGFWFSDLGYPWLRLLELLCLVFTLAALTIVVGYALRRKLVRKTPQGRVLRRRAIFSLLLLFFSLTLRLTVDHLNQPTALTAISVEEFRELYERDRTYYFELSSQLDSMLLRAMDSELSALSEDGALSADQERFLLETWSAFTDLCFSLDQIRRRWEIWYHFDLGRSERPRLIESYLLTYAAELSLYRHALRFDLLIQSNQNLQKYLDATQGEDDRPYWTYAQARQSYLGVADQSRVLAGERYLRWLREAFAPTDGSLLGGPLARDIDRHLEEVKMLHPKGDLLLEQSPDLEILKREVHRNWYPLQKRVAEWMGDTRLQRGQTYLITSDQLTAMDTHLEPGDILLSRKNWYLSNVGLPGFWPHAILYLGDPEKLQSFFRVPEVTEWLKTLPGEPESLGDALNQIRPDGWAFYQGSHEGEPYRVIEALGEGVLLHTLTQTAGDYLAALRPKLSKLNRAQAIYEAFHHYGKPYDFDFDFATDHAIVCTELVWRSYRPQEDKNGLRLEPITLAGRSTLPANEIARLFSAEYTEEASQLDFVYFLDARESIGKAVVVDEAAFRRSYLRPKWDYFQQ